MTTSGHRDPNLLEGWAQIAAYLDVSAKTAQSYELQEPKLPVHREGSYGARAHVFAYKTEIDAWRKARHIPPPLPAAHPPVPEPLPLIPETGPLPRAPGPDHGKFLRIAAVPAGGVAALIAAVYLLRQPPVSLDAPGPATHGRLFWRRAAESAGPPRRIELPGAYHSYAASPDGRRLYATSQKKDVYIVDVRTGAVSTIALPEYPAPLAVDETRRIAYVGSKTGALMIVDLSSARVREVLQVGSVIHDVTLSPDGNNLYLALLHGGAKRLRLFPDRQWTRITSDVCPAFTRLDSSGGRLVVSYRCGGPGGRPGHDSVEIFDTQSGKLLDSLSGPPIVGGEHAFSPDGLTLWISGGDACSSTRYDHQGCPSVPSRISHAYRLQDRQIIRSVGLPPGSGNTASFLAGGSRVLFTGDTARVFRASDFSLLEATPFTESAGGVVSRDGSTAFFLSSPTHLEIVDAEPAACGDLGPGAVHFLAMDRAVSDTIENARVAPEEAARFGPGMVGHALRLSPEGAAMEIRGPATHRFGARDSTIAMYVKLDSPAGSVPLLEFGEPSYKASWRLSVLGDGRPRFAFQGIGGASIEVAGKTPLREDAWRHIALTKSARRIRMFVDGEPDGEAGSAEELRGADTDQPVRLGWSTSGTARFSGYVDEVAMWERTLPPEEVKQLVNRRVAGVCKP